MEEANKITLQMSFIRRESMTPGSHGLAGRGRALGRMGHHPRGVRTRGVLAGEDPQSPRGASLERAVAYSVTGVLKRKRPQPQRGNGNCDSCWLPDVCVGVRQLKLHTTWSNLSCFRWQKSQGRKILEGSQVGIWDCPWSRGSEGTVFVYSFKRWKGMIFLYELMGHSMFISSVQGEWLPHACFTWCNYMVWCS